MLLQTDNFHPFSVAEGSTIELIDVFAVPGKKTIHLHPHSSLTYLVVGSPMDADISIVTS